MPPRQPIVILISGRGSNMRALIESSQSPDCSYAVAAVICDKPNAGGLEAAARFGIATRTLPAAKGMERSAYDAALALIIEEYSPSLVALAGFMRILSPQFVARFAGKILNIHPSLLPKYTGLHTHQRAIDAKDTEHGVTVHFVSEQLDDGPRILQARVPVLPGDTEAALAERVLTQEHVVYPLAVDWFCQGRLRWAAGKAWLDGKALEQPVQLEDLKRETSV
jgi:phosphoribosylglycinamide formyltransferase 1